MSPLSNFDEGMKEKTNITCYAGIAQTCTCLLISLTHSFGGVCMHAHAAPRVLCAHV